MTKKYITALDLAKNDKDFVHVGVTVCQMSVDLNMLEKGEAKCLSMTWEEVADLIREKGKLLRDMVDIDGTADLLSKV